MSVQSFPWVYYGSFICDFKLVAYNLQQHQQTKTGIKT